MDSEPENPFGFKPQNRLSQVLGGPDAKTFRVLVAKAETNVDLIRNIVGASLAKDLDQLIALASRPEADVLADLDGLDRAALHIAENATVAEKPAMAQVAAGIADLIEFHRVHGVWHPLALRLHVDALRLLQAGGSMQAADLAQLQGALEMMREHLVAKQTAAEPKAG